MPAARGSIIVRTWIKLRVREISDEGFNTYFDALESTATRTAREIFGHGYQAKLRAREGSLFLTVTIVGGAIGGLILGTQKFLADYPKMKLGLAEIIEDSKTFVLKFRERFVHKVNAKPDEIEKFEGKPVAPLQLIELLDQLAAIHEQKDAERTRRVSVDALRLRDALQKSLSKADWELLEAAMKPRLLEIEEYRPQLEAERAARSITPSFEPNRAPRAQRRKRRRSKTVNL